MFNTFSYVYTDLLVFQKCTQGKDSFVGTVTKTMESDCQELNPVSSTL